MLMGCVLLRACVRVACSVCLLCVLASVHVSVYCGCVCVCVRLFACALCVHEDTFVLEGSVYSRLLALVRVKHLFV